MSVAQLDARELASVAASAVRLGLCQLADVADMLATVSAANAAALASQYGDQAEPADAAEIESLALDILADRLDAIGWAPLTYNCFTNDGTGFLPAQVADRVRSIEDACRKHEDREQAQAARAEANAVAYDDVPRLPTMDADQLRQAMTDAGADRVILARFRVDESDGHTDYYGGRTTREVVIGLGRGRRESFAQLRKAAAGFKPTADYGPGLSRWHAQPVTTEDYTDERGHRVYAGTVSGWHRELVAGPLPTRAAADAHAAANPLSPLNMAHGPIVPLAWSIKEDSIEHRENYSMGGGNYLGDSRYGGWTVCSSTWLPASIEFFSLTAHGTKARTK
jgi:hypothetical protein